MADEFKLRTVYLAIGITCFAVLGGLTGRHVGSEPIPIGLFAVGCALFAAVGLAVLGLLLGLFSPGVRRQHGQQGVVFVVAKGFLMLLPFTALAAMAELYLGWNAVQAFTSAGIMMAGGMVGAETVKLGGGRLAGMVVPMATAFVISAGWMFISAMAQGIGRG